MSSKDLPSIKEVLTEWDLPFAEEYIEEGTETIEDADGNTFAEVKDIVPPWPELLRLVDEVRDSIPDIPEIKYYDDDLEKISQTIEELRSEIPVVPKVKYYDDQLNYIEDKFNEDIQKLYENIEVKDFESRVDVDTLKTNLKEML